MSAKKILIIEPHPYHIEILPGFTKYFQDLGYQVDVLIRKELLKQKVFCKMKNKPNIIPYDIKKIKEILSKDSIKEYDFLFCSSMEFLHNKDGGFGFDFRKRFIDYLGFVPKTKYGVMGAYHTIDFIKEFKDYDLYNQSRLFTLSGFEFEGEKTKLLIPHYFGENELNHKLNKKIKFITVGTVKDYPLIKNTVRQLIKEGIKDFEVIIASRSRLKVPLRLFKYIKHLRNPNFEKLYNQMVGSDFYLPLLDPSNPLHQHYLSRSATGSKSLIFGFLKPCLINSTFGEIYGFKTQDSILYEENNLYNAVKYAINMKQDEYDRMQCNLKVLADRAYETSLNNLKNAIEVAESEK